MIKIITLILFAVLSSGCFKVQRAAGCNNVGFLGCKDKPIEMAPSDSESRSAATVDCSPSNPNRQVAICDYRQGQPEEPPSPEM